MEAYIAVFVGVRCGVDSRDITQAAVDIEGKIYIVHVDVRHSDVSHGAAATSATIRGSANLEH